MRAQYYGMIGDVDEQLGRVCDALVELGMWDSTLIIVTADHAEQLGDHGALSSRLLPCWLQTCLLPCWLQSCSAAFCLPSLPFSHCMGWARR
jgi:arylsulfatase A-like enzyme